MDHGCHGLSSAGLVSSQKLDSANLDVFYSPQIGSDGKATLSSLFLISVEDIVSCARGDKDFSCGRRAWLGDTLFHPDVSKILYQALPYANKGELTQARQTLEANAAMAVFLREGTDFDRIVQKQLTTHAIGASV